MPIFSLVRWGQVVGNAATWPRESDGKAILEQVQARYR